MANEGGAGFMNAAELARDSLKAYRLARTRRFLLFRRTQLWIHRLIVFAHP